MTKVALVLSLPLAASLMVPVAAPAANEGAYAYATFGQIRDSVDKNAMDSLAGTPVQSSTRDNPLTVKLQLAYRFRQGWAIEGGIVESRDMAYDSSRGRLDRKYSIVNLSAAGILPLSDKFSATARIGVASSRVKVDGALTNGLTFDGGRRTAPTFGFGLKYDLGQNFSLRGDFDS